MVYIVWNNSVNSWNHKNELYHEQFDNKIVYNNLIVWNVLCYWKRICFIDVMIAVPFSSTRETLKNNCKRNFIIIIQWIKRNHKRTSARHSFYRGSKIVGFVIRMKISSRPRFTIHFAPYSLKLAKNSNCIIT